MTLHSGFFDAIESNGNYDRTYSSADYCDNLATVIKNGVRYSSDNDLVVTPGNAMAITVGIGRAWINGHYLYNDTAYTSLTIATAPTGGQSRIDRVVARLDTSLATRAISLEIIQGTAAQNPIAPALTRNDSIYDICLAEITVPAGATAITADMIKDTRADGTICGWASSVTPAIMSMLRQYVWTTTLSGTATTVEFDISQYNPQDVCILDVYTNGILETPGVDYTISGSTITFTQGKTAGTEIMVVLYKSIDGTGLESVADQVEALQNAVDKLDAAEQYIYECNGTNDNVQISNIAQAFLNGGTNFATMRITVVGQNFGASAPASGNGSASNPYKWFNLGLPATAQRRVIVDFTNAGTMTLPITAGTTNQIFAGADCHVIGAHVVAFQGAANTAVQFFNGTGAVFAENCYFRTYTGAGSYIATNGTFKNCRGFVTSASANSVCFPAAAGCAVIVEGGVYKAYTKTGSNYSAVFAVWYSNAAVIANNVKCPTIAETGYQQTYLATCPSGFANLTNIISTLSNNGSVKDTNRINMSLTDLM